MGKIRLLDCTLRDGAYIVDSRFGTPAIRGIIDKLCDTGADIIECGWLKNNEHEEGTCFYHVPDDMLHYMAKKNKNTTYTVMIDWDRYDLSYLPECDGRSVDAVRVVFPRGRHREGIEVGRQIAAKGYKVFFQAANTLSYSDEELIALAEDMNKIMPVAVSVVDTFGAMYEEDLDRILKILDEKLDKKIQLGFHSHNNQQLSFALTIHFINVLKNGERDIVVDSSLCGMGRGAGNATTELVVSYLNKKCGAHYDLDAVMDAIDIYMGYFKENFSWGYSTPYFIAGLYCCHVNNIAYLLKNHRTGAKDMRNIIESLSPADRQKYDYDLLEKKYLQNQNRYIDDAAAEKALKEAFEGRNILLVAPGKSAVSDMEKVKKYIADNDPVVIGVNAILQGYNYDFVFFVNPARYEYAQQAAGGDFDKFKKILLSNIKTEPLENEYIMGFNNAIKRGWEHFDNAAICCLRLMDHLGMEKVAIAGFDGFKTGYNESYADPFLPTLNPGKKWEELNNEILSMFTEFKRGAKHCRSVEFVTESFFDK
ncbi:MAG: hypothetical protein IJL89_00870 [Firmicutes bacterium]|nr:hypothetical protein [Bacillota bacterium]